MLCLGFLICYWQFIFENKSQTKARYVNCSIAIKLTRGRLLSMIPDSRRCLWVVVFYDIYCSKIVDTFMFINFLHLKMALRIILNIYFQRPLQKTRRISNSKTHEGSGVSCWPNAAGEKLHRHTVKEPQRRQAKVYGTTKLRSKAPNSNLLYASRRDRDGSTDKCVGTYSGSAQADFQALWQERHVRPRLDNTITVMHILKTGSLRYTRCLVVTQVGWECALSKRKQLLLSTYQESWISFQSVRAGCSRTAAFGCLIVRCSKLSWFCFCYLGSICLQTIWMTNWLVSGVRD